MWEKFKENFLEWLGSDNFVWCMLGWELSEFINHPSWITAALLSFWIWVLVDNR